MKVGLVACSGMKHATPSGPMPAKDIYRGVLFKWGRRMVERECSEWRILSALHGVLDPDQPIERYDVALMKLSAEAYNGWVEGAARFIARRFRNATLLVMAGAEYRTAVALSRVPCVIPAGIERLAIGLQVRRIMEREVAPLPSILVVGIAPARSSRGGRAFVGSASGSHLESLLGLQRGELGAVCDTANLYPKWPGEAKGESNGDAEPPAEEVAKAAASLDLAGYDRLILCGRSVAAAFGLKAGPLEVAELRGRRAIVMPHPSRVSRWWNAPENAAAARAALRAFSGELARRVIE